MIAQAGNALKNKNPGRTRTSSPADEFSCRLLGMAETQKAANIQLENTLGISHTSAQDLQMLQILSYVIRMGWREVHLLFMFMKSLTESLHPRRGSVGKQGVKLSVFTGIFPEL